MSRVVCEGSMVRYGRRKIGRSYLHRRYFILEPRVLAYYKKKPEGNMVPVKTIEIDGNCRVEDRGLKTHHGLNVYAICVCNKEKNQKMSMAAFNIEEALTWKKNIESAIDQQQSNLVSVKTFDSFEYKEIMDNGRTASSSDRDSQGSPDEEEIQRSLSRRTTIGNGPPASVLDWTRELDSGLSFENSGVQVPSRKHWRLVRCQNGLRIFEELLEVDYLPRSCSRAMKAVGAVDATCEEIFQLIMSMDGPRFEWDCSFQYGSLVEEVDGHTAILYHRLQLDYFSKFVWPRDLCYVRYWRCNDDGSYVVLFRSREHANCGPQPGFVRAHIESGGFKISPLKPRNRRPRTQVQHLMQIDLKGWGLGYFPSFQQHCLLKMLNSVAGLREWFAQTDFPVSRPPRIPVMPTIPYDSIPSTKVKSMHHPTASMDQMNDSSRLGLLDEDSDDDDDFQTTKTGETYMDKLETDIPSNYSFHKKLDSDIKRTDDDICEKIDLTMFSGNLRRDDRDNCRNCWRLSGGNNFRVRSKQFPYDKSKIPAGKPLMDLVAVDWLKDVKRMDHVSRRRGCAVQVASERGLFSLAINLQVPASMHYSMVFYFVMKELPHGSLLQQFVDGDDEFRNSRLKLIPSVPKGSWIVRQSVGSTPCLLGKAVDCTYIRGPNYLEIDVDIGSSTVANGVLGLVFGVITTLVVDMAFLVQGNTYDELPERLIAAVRMSHIELKTAMDPGFEGSSSSESSQ